MYDVTIRGAGIFGLSIAWDCISRGAKVQVIDPNGVGSGASGGIVGALAPHVPENWNAKKEIQFQSLLQAEPFWSAVDEVSGLSSGYIRSGRLQPILDQASLDLARQRSVNATSLWQNKARFEVITRPPRWAPRSPINHWVFDTLSAHINPFKACTSLAAALKAKQVAFACEGEDEGVTVWATGVHDLLRISQKLNMPFGNGVKGQAVLFDCDKRNAPQMFADTLHFVPHQDGTLAVGSTSERDYSDPSTTDQTLDTVIKHAIKIFPELKQARILRKWAGVRPRAKSRAPVLGRHPLDPDAFIANGGFKIGFGMAPAIAKMMANLMLEGENAIPVEFTPEACMPQPK